MMKRIGIFLFAWLCTSCSPNSSQKTQGYVEGQLTYMTSPVSGALKALFVDRGSAVKQGDKLFVLETQPESDLFQAAVANLKQATASRDAVSANLAYAKITYERNLILYPQKAIQASQLDNSKSIYEATKAQLVQANAAMNAAAALLAEAKWKQDQKIIYAPVDAAVFDTYYQLGEYVVANQAVLSLLSPSDIKVIFYVGEKILGGIKLNDTISVTCDGCRQPYSGQIHFISQIAEYTPPVIYSNETNEKLIYRIEAEFPRDQAIQLHPGQPVMVSYTLHG